MKIYNGNEIDNMSKEALQKALDEIQKEYLDLEDQYSNLDDDYSELEDENYGLQTEIDNLNAQVEYIQELVDIEDLKEKLEFYGLKSEELWNFLDNYMRLYNK